MSDVRTRLTACFAAVFPGLPPERVRTASVESVPEWDSVMAVNLVAVVEEEFGVRVDPQDLERLVSFPEIERYLEVKLGAGAG